jgi:hypothetical protein
MNECEIYTAWSIIGFLITVIILRVDDNLRCTNRNFLYINFLNPKLAVLLLIFGGPLTWTVIAIEFFIDSIFSNLD